MSVITRFAPSPTGYLHIGGARTALFNFLFAKRHNGKYLLRIEDTDQERSTETAINAIKSGLNWLMLTPDEKTIFQSDNLHRHKQVAEILLKSGRAYKCYLNEDEQNKIRQECIKNGLPFRSPWRDKENNKNNSFVLRIRMPNEGKTIIDDMVQGKVQVSNKQLDDFVLLRSNGLPTYMLAVVVDDYDMGITHVIRGDDHLNNAFRQYWIYQALNWKIPNFAHIPLIHGEDGAKLSKRHGALGVNEYKEMGFLPNGINAYLMNLGWKNFENNTLELNQASKIFDLNHIGKSPSRFDFSKLKNINSQLLKKLNVTYLTTLVLKTVQNPSQNSKDRLHKAMPYLLERAETINDLIQSSMWLCTDDYKNIFKETPSLNETDLIRLSSFKDSFQNYKISSKNELENHFNTWLAKENIKIKEIGRHLRLCLTGTGSSIDLLSIFYLLGCSEIVKRIDYNINCLN